MGSETGLFAAYNRLIGSAVRVESADLTFSTGVLYCIDPESDSAVLLNECEDRSSSPSDNEWSVKIFLGHSVVAIHADDQQRANPTLKSIRQCLHVKHGALKQDVAVGPDALLRHREQLCAFLRQRFILCEDSNSSAASISVFGGAARVLAPFTAASIECANEQILARLQQLLLQFDARLSR
ncbi:Ankyrin repeat-containing protein [Globisporangium polare]